MKVAWRNEAVVHFNEILEYLQKESENAAFIVGNAILDEVEALSLFETAHPLDRFKINNDGNYRAFIVYNYRISYFIENNTIYILRIRHTSREPLRY
ncbi:MAG: hypothetical protein A2046_03650 [Bacteroidetes bacterium GWA2_30_7]|nr:MAG: hypothetical protein A2046_03650 [Bacteroidetes bacterium GWA2_30_7]